MRLSLFRGSDEVELISVNVPIPCGTALGIASPLFPGSLTDGAGWPFDCPDTLLSLPMARRDKTELFCVGAVDLAVRAEEDC